MSGGALVSGTNIIANIIAATENMITIALIVLISNRSTHSF
jgi:hypothetical protein